MSKLTSNISNEQIRKVIREEIKQWFQTDFNIDLDLRIRNTLKNIQDEEQFQKEIASERQTRERQHQYYLELIPKFEYLLDTYIDSSYSYTNRPVITFRDGQQWGYGFASQMTGDPGDFKKLGFTNMEDFYKIPLPVRNYFCRTGLRKFQENFPYQWNRLPLEDLITRSKLFQDFLKELVTIIRNPSFAVP